MTRAETASIRFADAFVGSKQFCRRSVSLAAQRGVSVPPAFFHVVSSADEYIALSKRPGNDFKP